MHDHDLDRIIAGNAIVLVSLSPVTALVVDLLSPLPERFGREQPLVTVRKELRPEDGEGATDRTPTRTVEADPEVVGITDIGVDVDIARSGIVVVGDARVKCLLVGGQAVEKYALLKFDV